MLDKTYQLCLTRHSAVLLSIALKGNSHTSYKELQLDTAIEYKFIFSIMKLICFT